MKINTDGILALEQIQNGVEDFILIHGAWLCALAHALQQGTDQLELLPTDIAWIRLSWLHSPELAFRWRSCIYLP